MIKNILISDYKENKMCTNYFYTFSSFNEKIIKEFLSYLEKEVIVLKKEVYKTEEIHTLIKLDNCLNYLLNALENQDKNNNTDIEKYHSNIWDYYCEKILVNKNVLNKVKEYIKTNKNQDNEIVNYLEYWINSNSYQNKNNLIVEKRMEVLLSKIENNIEKYKNKVKNCIFVHRNNFDILKGIKFSQLKRYFLNAQKSNIQDGILIDMDKNYVYYLLRVIENRDFRKTIYATYMNSYKNNKKLLLELLKEKENLSLMNKKNNYFELVSSNYFIKDLNSVNYFVNTTIDKFEKKNNQWLDLLKNLSKIDKIEKFEPWDFHYYENKVFNNIRVKLEDKYDLKLENVIKVLFSIIETNFNLTITEKNNENGIYYEIKDKETQRVGYLILNIYEEEFENFYNCVDLQKHFKIGNNYSCYIGKINGSFGKNKESKVSLFEMIDLGHELGHALHAFYSQYDYKVFNYAWDLIELPSQFLEKFLLNKDILLKFIENDIKYSLDEKKKDINEWLNYKSLADFSNLRKTIYLNKKIIDLYQNNYEYLNNKKSINLALENSLNDELLLDRNFLMDYNRDYSATNYIYLMNDIMADYYYNNLYKNNLHGITDIYRNIFNNSKKDGLHLNIMKTIDLSNLSLDEYLNRIENKKGI